MADPASPTLPCKQCGYVNEPERVYCHNCGTKLDRSVLPKDEQVRRESPDTARRRIKRMTNPDKNVIGREIKTFFETILFAAVAAVLIDIWRPPDGVPPVKGDVLPRLISSDLSDAVEAPRPQRLIFTESEINAYLKGAIKESKNADFLSSIIQFKRAFVHLRPGVCGICMEKSLWGLPLYFETDYKLEVLNGAFTATNVAGSLGRLPVHPLLLQGVDYLFSGLWTALHREHDNMKEMQAISIEKERMVLVTRGGTKR